MPNTLLAATNEPECLFSPSGDDEEDDGVRIKPEVQNLSFEFMDRMLRVKQVDWDYVNGVGCRLSLDR